MNSAQRLKFIRKKLKLTQEKLAISIGLKRDNITSLESEKVKISTLHAIAMEHLYCVNKDWLLYGKGDIFIDGNKKDIKKSEDDSPNVTKVIIEHQGIVKRFKDPERGLRMNQRLLDIQDISEDLYDTVETYIKGVHDAAQTIKDKSKKKNHKISPTKKRANGK